MKFGGKMPGFQNGPAIGSALCRSTGSVVRGQACGNCLAYADGSKANPYFSDALLTAKFLVRKSWLHYSSMRGKYKSTILICEAFGVVDSNSFTPQGASCQIPCPTMWWKLQRLCRDVCNDEWHGGGIVFSARKAQEWCAR